MEKSCYTLRETQVIIERWRHQHNTVRPLSSLKNKPPPLPNCINSSNTCLAAARRLN